MSELNFTDEEKERIDLKYRIEQLKKIASMIPSRYKIMRHNPLNTITFKTPQPLDYERYDLGQFLSFSEERNSIITNFIKTLENYSDKINLSTAYTNLKSLKISDEESESINRIISKCEFLAPGGLYFASENKIWLNSKEKKDNSLTHELIHFASSREKNGISYSGFSQYNGRLLVNKGFGIDEGVTEYINSILFRNGEFGYRNLVYIVKGIVNLIGEEKLIQLYFNNDLQGLIEEISKYSSKKTANTIILAMDKMYNLHYTEEAYKKNNPIITIQNDLIELLASLNLKKQQKLLEDNKITQEKYYENVFNNVDVYREHIIMTKKEDKYNAQILSEGFFFSDSHEISEESYKQILKEYTEKVKQVEYKFKKNELKLLIDRTIFREKYSTTEMENNDYAK